MKLTGTNRPITYTTHPSRERIQKTFTPWGGYKETRLLASTMWFPTNKPVTRRQRCDRNRQLNNNTTAASLQRPSCNHQVFPPPATAGGTGNRVTAVIAWGKRPVPSRTRKLRPTAPMVLHPGGCGRVGHRRNIITRSRTPNHVGGPPAFNPHPPNDDQPTPRIRYF